MYNARHNVEGRRGDVQCRRLPGCVLKAEPHRTELSQATPCHATPRRGTPCHGALRRDAACHGVAWCAPKTRSPCQVVSTSTQYVNAASSLLGLADGALVWLCYWRQFSPNSASLQPKGHTCSHHTICSAAHLVADWGCARELGHLLVRPTALRAI